MKPCSETEQTPGKGCRIPGHVGADPCWRLQVRRGPGCSAGALICHSQGGSKATAQPFSEGLT